MKPLRAVVFDLGKVLLDFDYSKVVDRLARAGTGDHAAVRKLLLESSLLSDYESGILDSESFYHRLRNALELTLDYPAFRAAFGDIFSPIREMLAAQQTLHTRGVPTFVLSNTNEIAISHIRERYAFFHEFDGYILSHEVGAMKPAPAIYQALETRAERAGADLCYLDDLGENVAAAAARGWQACLHTCPQTSLTFLRDAGFPA